jgi:hypothetical protein
MTSFRQIAANRRNASKSTGPATAEGKLRSRCNPVRHGLTAETVIGVLEDAEDYRAFEEAIAADYDAQSVAERELVLRLASLLWRLRRATKVETGLFEIQADNVADIRNERHAAPGSRQIGYATLGQPHSAEPDDDQSASRAIDASQQALRSEKRPVGLRVEPSVDLARSFLRLINLPNFALDRLNRYEMALWRQVGQTLFALDALDRRKPQERTHRPPARDQQEPHIYRHDER